VLGGMGSLFGPLIGAVALLVFEEALSQITEYWQIILGPLLLLVVLFARGGIVGLLTSWGDAARGAGKRTDSPSAEIQSAEPRVRDEVNNLLGRSRRD